MTRPEHLIKADLIETTRLCLTALGTLHQALVALRQSQAGYPSGGDGGGHGGDVVDLSSRLDERGNLIDDASRELDQLDRDARKLHGLATATFDRTARWSRPPTSAQKAKDAGAGDPGCEICARFTNSQDQPHWSPAHVEDSNVKGNLERGYRLCVWHHRFVLAQGRLPTKAETKAHLSGKRVRVKGVSQNSPPVECPGSVHR